MATFDQDNMRRLVLISDGNNNLGELDRPLAAAISRRIPIDVFPLRYAVGNEIMVERFDARWKHKNEPFTIDILLKSTNAGPVGGKLYVEMIDSDGGRVAPAF